jgi:hypothetical protein
MGASKAYTKPHFVREGEADVKTSRIAFSRVLEKIWGDGVKKGTNLLSAREGCNDRKERSRALERALIFR